MGWLARLFGKKKGTLTKRTLDRTEKISTRTETLSVRGKEAAISKILQLYGDKNVRCFYLCDCGNLLARVSNEMTQSDLEYIIMCASFHFSNVSSTIDINIERIVES